MSPWPWCASLQMVCVVPNGVRRGVCASDLANLGFGCLVLVGAGEFFFHQVSTRSWISPQY